MNYIDEITKLQRQIDSNKLEQAKLQERQKNLKEEKEKLIKELNVYEIEEKNLDNEIKKIEDEIQKELTKCQELLK